MHVHVRLPFLIRFFTTYLSTGPVLPMPPLKSPMHMYIFLNIINIYLFFNKIICVLCFSKETRHGLILGVHFLNFQGIAD